MRNIANRMTRRAGFTLIEMLVVIAIVAVIAAILFPVFATVRERGRRTVCQSNLKQIALAMQQYVQDDGGVYPPEAYLGWNADGTPRNSVEWFHLVYPYVKTRQAFYCPSAPADAPAHTEGVNWENWDFVDYIYDTPWLNKFHEGTSKTAYFYGVAESTLATPASITINIDPNWITPDGVAHYIRDVKTSCGYEFAGSTLHSNGGNYSFVDGHVKWLTPEEMGEIECLNGPLPPPVKN